jgi:hypothetical protein
MTPTMIYLTGQPGAGKSTLMARLTADYERISYGPPERDVPFDVLTDAKSGETIGAEIGKQRGLFSGTDALASSIIERAIPWVQSIPFRLLLAEGARLSNARFITAAADAGYYVTLFLLDHPDAETWRAARSKDIGRPQDPNWVKGRLTASRNLADKLTDDPHHGRRITVFRGHPDELYPIVSGMLGVTERASY